MTCIGIDLGTTYSCVAVVIKDKVQVIPSETGQSTVPSIVSFDADERLVGDGARDQMRYNFRNTVYGIKRLIGRLFSDPRVQEDISRFPYTVNSKGGGLLVQVKYKGQVKNYTAEEISSMILGKLKLQAEQYLGKEVHDAVITVPAYFNSGQREATKNAGTIAGLNVLNLISEPTAAAIGFGQAKQYKEETKIFVFDFGGGTFDVSILKVKKGEFTVLAVGGDTHLGGEDIDNLLVDYCVEHYEKEHGACLSKNERALRRLKEACEKAKRMLSSATKSRLDLQCLTENEDFLLTLTRSKFEEICTGTLKKTLDISKNVLKEAGVKPGDIDEVLLVGGSTRIPRVRALVQRLFSRVPDGSIHPDEAVAIGAAIQAANATSVETKMEIILNDIVPMTVGTKVEGGLISSLLKKNTPIPAKVQTNYVTTSDNQRSITFDIFEGERTMAIDNNLLGSFTISGLNPERRGKAGASVTAEIDESGIIRISATSTNGKEDSISLTNSASLGLSPQEVAILMKEAEGFQGEDRLQRERAEAMLDLKNLVYELRNLAESGHYSGDACTSLMALFTAKLKWIENNPHAAKKDYNEVHAGLSSKIETLLASKSSPPRETALRRQSIDTEMVARNKWRFFKNIINYF